MFFNDDEKRYIKRGLQEGGIWDDILEHFALAVNALLIEKKTARGNACIKQALNIWICGSNKIVEVVCSVGFMKWLSSEFKTVKCTHEKMCCLL